jgi:protease-4
MSDVPAAPSAAPVPELPPPRPTVLAVPLPPQQGWSCLGVAFGMSLLINLAAVVVLVLVCAGMLFFRSSDSDTLPERFYSGNKKAKHNKIAIIHVEGVLMEGFVGYARKQIEEAARDKDVKAVVLRVNSPGGTITASDDLYHRLVRLREGTAPQSTGKKPIVVSMASLAASGGYYISMAGDYLFAEETTLTGSIGVYAAFPNVEKLGDKIGFKMDVIKQGEVKDGGSPFKTMTDQERAVWQDMVDSAYNRFCDVVDKGRPRLGRKLTDKLFDLPRDKKGPDGKPVLGPNGKPVTFQYVRRLADGGIFTARAAERFKLIDKIGYLESALDKAAELADLSPSEYQAIQYERPRSLAELLLGIQSGAQPATLLDPSQLASGLTPRLWYLAPQSELAGLAAAMRSRP